ncbi:tRNA lysidine(34) synthetase TilS [Novosphingobium sp. 9U]|uniref:tRNA lysidine(34) synthetase TilS n=1 Tax=Novosphingobium sp. 9U TaxID=2653158 RepID=UPI001F26BDC3|nr:tRNA lysidine(34) synthetase TilS [Novosphingobium sp. 9U]
MPTDLSARFEAALRAVWPELDDVSAPRLGLAVSGGPDSTALLLLAASVLPGRIEAATVDHGLRAENAQEAADVAALCARLEVPHATLPVTVEAGNVQGAARQARYAALGTWAQELGLIAVATAHHADDQAETLIMRLNRASGVAGLAGVRPRGRLLDMPIGLVRPLLGWRRVELASVVTEAGVTSADDPSNADDRFDRARLRKAMAGADWLDVAAVAQSAAHLADADAALSWSAELEYNARVKRDPFGLTYRPMAPRAIALRVVARIVEELDTPARGSAVARLFDALVVGEPASIGALVVRPNAGGWSFAKAPMRKAVPKRG